LSQGSLFVAEYEAYFCELSRHAMNIVTDEVERVRRLVRGLNFSVRSYMFRAAREGASFHSIVRTAKEAKFIVLEDFMDLKRARSSCQFSGASSIGKGLHRGSSSFQRRGPVHASMPTVENGQSPRGSYGSG